MGEQASHHEQTVDPSPSRPADLDLPTLGRLVDAEAQDMYQNTGLVVDELKNWTRGQPGAQVARRAGRDTEIAPSLDELTARLSDIGQSAYRLARHVRTLVELEAIQLAHCASTEAG